MAALFALLTHHAFFTFYFGLGFLAVVVWFVSGEAKIPSALNLT
jgi:cbb3-type cytochrome oxidase subunit 3